jgi:hypothetical protein
MSQRIDAIGTTRPTGNTWAIGPLEPNTTPYTSLLGVDKTSNTDGNTSYTSDSMCVCIPSGVPENGTLDSVEVFYDDAGSSDDWRIAVYENGTSDTNMDTAGLVFDSGEQTADGPTLNSPDWVSVTAGGESLTSGTRLWIALKAQGSMRRWYTPQAENNDVTDFVYATGMGNDEAVAFVDPCATTSSSLTGKRPHHPHFS